MKAAMDTLIARFGIALSVGLLVGLERGWQERQAPAGSRTAGIRTFGISGLLGGVLAAIADALQYPMVFPIAFLAFAATLGVFKLREARSDSNYSVTTVMAGLGVFALGGLAVTGDAQAAAAGGAALAATLATRDVLHSFLKRLTWVELRSALVLAVMTAVILPILPNQAVDPWGGLNPWKVWFFTVLTASLSFLGYIAVRMLGARKGLIVSAIAGSLVSSTAVTMVLARTARLAGGSLPLAGAAALGAAVSILRVMALILVIDPGAIVPVGPTVSMAAILFAGCGLAMFYWPQDKPLTQVPASNPFEIGPLLIFAAIFAAAAVASAVMVSQFGSVGFLATVALTGTVDVDVAVLSALQTPRDVLPLDVIGRAILIAAAANALCRAGIAAAVGPLSYSIPLAVVTVVAVAAAYAAYAAAALIW
ncbi:MgtC/SapB family protein [Shinella sp.]|uniref:MgtC/SapB family protein n=1 Tax=Shinella sp. TaxID=1870904 RepID=UPI0029BD4A9A|nr:MgtC/SapB family protein [Shinella sp.]MDX3972511.1 MgtC/SapB family protein [Shinella sp.]